MAEHEYPSTNLDGDSRSAQLWSGPLVDQEPLLLLAELASEITTATDFDALQQILARKLRWILDFDQCTLAIRLEDLDKEYLLLEVTSPSKAKSIPPQKIPIESGGWPGRVLTDSKPYFIEELAQLSTTMPLPSAQWGIALDARSLMLLPLRVGERTVGSLNFSSHATGAYSVLWRNLASLLASQVGGQLGTVLSQAQLKKSCEFRERVMESVADAIYTLDLEGKFTLVNQRTAEMTGYSVKELIGRSFLTLFYPQEANQIQSLILATIECGASINQYEAELVTKDGSRKNITFNLAPLFIGEKISAVVSTAQNISERKQAETVLLRAKIAEAANLALECQVQERTLQLQQALALESRLKNITDKVRDSLDESQIVQASVKELALGLSVGCCNMAMYNLEYGTSTICYEYAISIPASQGRTAQMADFPELYHQLLQNQYFQFCSIVPHPHRGRVAMLACPISDDQGVMGDLWLINWSQHIFNDPEVRLVQQVANQCAIAIRQARLYQAATAQVKELEKLNQLKDDFLSTVSHELRTPITNMMMAIHMMKMVSDTQRRERYLEILQTECAREAELINDLLDLQRLEATSYHMSLATMSLQDWLPSIVEPFYSRTQSRQQTLRVALSPNHPTLLSDSTSLGRILTELLNNACKYTSACGEISMSIHDYNPQQSAMTQRSARHSPQVGKPAHGGGSGDGSGCAPAQAQHSTSATVFSIRNSTEIPTLELPRIFEKFYRVNHADPWKQGGTGLGLALVQKLVEQLQGTIQVESSKGWTTFTVQLPNKPMQELTI